MAPLYKTRRAWAEAALILLATAALVAVAFAACSGNDDSTDPPATSTTVDPDEAAEEEVRQAYRDFLEMAFRVAANPDPADPGIATHSTGAARTSLEEAAAQDRARGVVIHGGPEDSQTILSTSVDGDTAVLSVCYVGQSGAYDAATGAELVPMEIITTLDRVELLREAGTWKVRSVGNDEEDK
jgi:hypothetical protein